LLNTLQNLAAMASYFEPNRGMLEGDIKSYTDSMIETIKQKGSMNTVISSWLELIPTIKDMDSGKTEILKWLRPLRNQLRLWSRQSHDKIACPCGGNVEDIGKHFQINHTSL
jgi:hypothetical protein